ncbi:hypothetical protein ABL78_6196 [Leptomonas seymouri]|uniref:BRO1 domain-containing protein n=1 Tax=Leptomonas seymouri TaxID=5684 RepID=A0A0N1PB01_LEPSE|nr:hypothetical protein ABL78_6196 [Leptomonas seymouri]|eukprot:KPI84751.1 hypothetical protein ABL78_6196 [Leptomonas seymouri]
MYSFLPSSATHAESLDWARLVCGALAVVKVAPTEEVSNALVMMNSYAMAPSTVFGSLNRGVRDVKEYVALLAALDDAVSQWPLRLRQLLPISSVALVSAGTGVNGSLVTVPVRTPRGEALVFLLNVAVVHLEKGLDYVARVRADNATATSISTTQGGSVAAPNQNAKTAAQHFRQAVEVLHWSEALHAAPASPSAIALQQLRTQLPLDVTQQMAAMCAAVAKYMYALSSASTKNNPDVLAKLAFAAAQLPLPTSVLPTSSLQLLPSLLLAAYHYHQATWYYAHASSQGPEMAEALGHARYADALLRTCDAQWSMEEVHQEAEHESRQWWGRRLASLFSGAASRMRQRSSGAAMGSAATNLHTQQLQLSAARELDSTGDDNGTASPLKPATRYPHLHGLSTGKTATLAKADAESDTKTAAATPADVVQVYPYARLLLHDVCAALQQYEKENRVVYFAKVATADDVRRDVPDATGTSQRAGDARESERSFFESRADLFATLPSPAALQAALAKQEEVGQAQQALSRALQRVERDGRQLSAYVTPTAALEQALDALESILPNAGDWASPKGAVAVALEAVDAAFQAFKKVAAEWQEAHNVYVGENCPPHPSIEEAEREVVVWTQRATAALAQWTSLHLPPNVNSRAAFTEALVPRSADMRAYVEQVEGLSRDVRDVLAAEPGTVTQAQVQSAVDALDRVKRRGAELMAVAAVESKMRSRPSTSAAADRGNSSPMEELTASPQYERAEAVVLALVDVLQEAPIVVTHIERSTSKLMEMQEKVRVVPLTRLRDVRFSSNSDKYGSTSTASRSGMRGGTATPADNAKSTKRRLTGLTATASTTAAGSNPADSSRKRSRDDDDQSDFASVSSSQLGDAEEATQAAVSSKLLSRMKANKAKRSAGKSTATTGSVKEAMPRSTPRGRASPAATDKKAAKTKKSRTMR